MNYTPGPWKDKEVSIARQDKAHFRLSFLVSSSEERMNEAEANAYLIAAAPDLLEAAVYVMENLLQESAEVWEHEIAHLRYAINKAKGEY